MTRIIWARSAQDDIFDIGDHYDTIDPSLADDIMERLERSVLPLVDSRVSAARSRAGRACESGR